MTLVAVRTSRAFETKTSFLILPKKGTPGDGHAIEVFYVWIYGSGWVGLSLVAVLPFGFPQEVRSNQALLYCSTERSIVTEELDLPDRFARKEFDGSTPAKNRFQSCY